MFNDLISVLKVSNDLISALKVSIVCGGSYRRGKASCGDLDIIITHPDGKRYYIYYYWFTLLYFLQLNLILKRDLVPNYCLLPYLSCFLLFVFPLLLI